MTKEFSDFVKIKQVKDIISVRLKPIKPTMSYLLAIYNQQHE